MSDYKKIQIARMREKALYDASALKGVDKSVVKIVFKIELWICPINR